MHDQTKPPLDELAHYGVAGMKWGKTRAKASTTQIRDARVRDQKAHDKAFSAHKKASKIADPAARKKALDEAADMKIEQLKNPDRVIAARTTRGGKAIALLLSAGATGSIVPGLGYVAATSAHSRRIERKQELGKYDKKK